jgi:predicted transcriptional regulator
MKTRLLGELEQKIMEVLWSSKKPLKPAEVLKQLGGDHAYTTIMTVLKRMSDKKMLSRQLEGKVYFYSPVLNKEKFIETNLSGIFGDLLGSYGKLAISQFVDTVKDNKDDIELLKQYLKNNA